MEINTKLSEEDIVVHQAMLCELCGPDTHSIIIHRYLHMFVNTFSDESYQTVKLVLPKICPVCRSNSYEIKHLRYYKKVFRVCSLCHYEKQLSEEEKMQEDTQL